MDIKFEGKYKSITSFEWKNIPDFVVITGPNGTGKSQLLELIHNTFIPANNFTQKVQITGESFKASEVTFLKGEWEIQNTSSIDLSTLLRKKDNLFQSYTNRNHGYSPIAKVRIYEAFSEVTKKTGKSPKQLTKEEFFDSFPDLIIEEERTMSQKIGEIFYNYRLSEIQLQSEQKTKAEINNELGLKPWEVLKEIIKEAKLPFEINDPSSLKIRDSFLLKLTHTVLDEEIAFGDLSSGEKVLISLIFYLFNSQENNLFPKLFLLDEPDAHLHPSMTQQFLNVIKNVLVDKFGVKVIMTTHSPSTVIFSPVEAIFEMSRTEPRITKSPSKNHSVSLLTAGLIYVGEGTKYFLVEDNDDAEFYSYIFNNLINENKINSDIPLVFIPASTKHKSGGKDVVQNWVNKLQESGLSNILRGLIDSDSGNEVSDGVYAIPRYSIENYLIDPIVDYASLMDKEKHTPIPGIELKLGEEYKLKFMPEEKLQEIADSIFTMIESKFDKHFADFDSDIENNRLEVVFPNGQRLLYPQYILSRRGKTIINQIYNEAFTSRIVNLATLFKAFRKLNMFPSDLVDKLNEIQNGY